MKHAHIVVIAATALLLSGCGSSRLLETRVACTVDGGEAHVVSKWGPVGIASQIAAADARVLCKAGQ